MVEQMHPGTKIFKYKLGLKPDSARLCVCVCVSFVPLIDSINMVQTIGYFLA